MTKKQTVRKLSEVAEKVQEDISKSIRSGDLYSRGLSGEGHNGGYRDALYDAVLYINSGCLPNRNRWWEKEK